MLFDFYTEQETVFAQTFLKYKYIICAVENNALLHNMRKAIVDIAAKSAGIAVPDDDHHDAFLNTFHHQINPAALNDVRLQVIAEMNRLPWFRTAYFNLGKQILFDLVGNELSMQRRVNLSIQFPHDDSSLLPVHADVWSGDSPYEIVMWLPLVNCYETKSMYFTRADFDEATQAQLNRFKNQGAEDLFQAIQDKVEFLNVPFGSALFFSQNVMHGNRINRTDETRWSMNCRFKSILTPYNGKTFGEFFEPITVRPLTRLGLDYRLPEGFDE